MVIAQTKFSFVLRPDSGLSGPVKDCGQGRALSSALIEAKRRPVMAVLAGPIQDHRGEGHVGDDNTVLGMREREL